MRAWLLDGFRGINALRLGEAPDPTPAADEAVVKVKYAALNPADRYLAEKQYPARPTFPHILGRECLGQVVAAPAQNGDLLPGDRVIVLPGQIGADRPGTFAELVAVPASALVHVPAGWTDEQAAGAAVAYLTAWQALTRWGDLPLGYVLVTGASGGVGLASVHLARALGHKVVALTRTNAKRERLLEAGARYVLNVNEGDWVSELRHELGGRQVQLAIDSIGGTLLPQVIDTLAEHGRVSIVGRLAGPVPEFNTSTLLFQRISLGGVAVSAWTPEEMHHAWDRMLSVMQRRDVRPVVDSVHAFEDLPQAFARLAEGPFGKVLLTVG